jgi:hypothetical protein
VTEPGSGFFTTIGTFDPFSEAKETPEAANLVGEM